MSPRAKRAAEAEGEPRRDPRCPTPSDPRTCALVEACPRVCRLPQWEGLLASALCMRWSTRQQRAQQAACMQPLRPASRRWLALRLRGRSCQMPSYTKRFRYSHPAPVQLGRAACDGGVPNLPWAGREGAPRDGDLRRLMEEEHQQDDACCGGASAMLVCHARNAWCDPAGLQPTTASGSVAITTPVCACFLACCVFCLFITMSHQRTH